MMRRRSAGRLLESVLTGSMVFIAAGCDAGASDVALEPCPALAPDAAATIRLFMLPQGWSLSEAISIDALDRVREFDGAPASYVGAWIVDESGARVADTPVLMLVEGGTRKEHETYAKSRHPLNDVAVNIADSAYAEVLRRDPDSRRIPPTDARTLRTQYSESDSAAIAVLACLNGESVS